MPTDSYTGRTMSWATVKKCAHPFPVFQAHMSDGRVIRMGFWAPVNADDAELIERGRRFACFHIRHHGQPSAYDVMMRDGKSRQEPYSRTIRVIQLFIEDQRRPGEAFMIDSVENLDPWGPEAQPLKNGKRKAAVRKVEWQETLRELVACATNPAPELLRQAERLLAA